MTTVQLRLGLLVPWLLAGLMAGCHFPGQPDPKDRPLRPEEVKDFGVLFHTNCAGCHGADGQGGPAPPLNDPLFLTIMPPQEVEHLLMEGREGTLMPPFALENNGSLTKEQIDIVTEGLFANWKPKDPPKDVPPYRDDQKGDPKAGLTVYATACESCHGDQGQGMTAGAINDVAFLELISDDALRRIIITGRPDDLGMPPFNKAQGRPKDFKPLTSKEINDIVALMASWRQPGK